MKKNILFFLTASALSIVNAQVGIGTETPQGALDINAGNQANLGVVLPNVNRVEDVINLKTNEKLAAVGTTVYDMSRDAVCYKLATKWSCSSVNGNEIVHYSAKSTYIKPASYFMAGSNFGYDVALSKDGNTLAISQPTTISRNAGIFLVENPFNNFGAPSSNYGAVNVFKKENGVWKQEAFIKASNSHAKSEFGQSIALSADGNTLVVGAHKDSSPLLPLTYQSITGGGSIINGGAALIFKRNGSTWTEEKRIVPNVQANDEYFGSVIDVSGDGNTMIVGAYRRNNFEGAAYIYTKEGNTWGEEQLIIPNDLLLQSFFGSQVKLSQDGKLAFISTSATINFSSNRGAVYVYENNNGIWNQISKIQSTNDLVRDSFGKAISISGDGDILSVTTAVVNPNSTYNASVVNIYKRNQNTWDLTHVINEDFQYDATGRFGRDIDLSDDGKMLIVGVENITSHLFRFKNGNWEYYKELLGSNTEHGDGYGNVVAISGEGNNAVVGAVSEKSRSVLEDPDESQNVAASGAGYYF